MTALWMVRGEGGRLYDDFRERGVVAIGWSQLAGRVRPGMTRAEIVDIYRQADPHAGRGTLIAGASQVWRFINEIEIGDWVTSYSPFNRTYLVGRVTGDAVYREDWAEDGMALSRSVEWQPAEVTRDTLSTSTKNSLGSTLTVFLIPEVAAREMLAQLTGNSPPLPPCGETITDEAVDDAAVDPLADIETQAIERIKDIVSKLEPRAMEQLVAGILRAMGYKTQVSPVGPDRGKDIIASPDGFGFENPRIIVEVKHRKGQMDSQAIRSFLGGRVTTGSTAMSRSAYSTVVSRC